MPAEFACCHEIIIRGYTENASSPSLSLPHHTGVQQTMFGGRCEFDPKQLYVSGCKHFSLAIIRLQVHIVRQKQSRTDAEKSATSLCMCMELVRSECMKSFRC